MKLKEEKKKQEIRYQKVESGEARDRRSVHLGCTPAAVVGSNILACKQ
jgi:hypothetical protein